ncbi:immunity protein Imm33 domain-containing protein [Paraglaciecola chathamensis]|uniref:DUF2185 domain-containing protein n=1 Tax=Paraglaciecola agarilytica NO2 TaxID=1125747 RepID=A0ABQ0ICF9_9ALTE|nr:DUF2185 domain-containing protein [Paraglaciecola agarilytica]GAC07070.1 hypothetical protein GAGA_4243 [Paraglaciecola agarilytica NO2]
MQSKSWTLQDAQQLAADFPYTFYKPSNEVVSKFQPGNQVKLIFEFASDDPEAPSAERMWVEIYDHKNGVYSGYLNNEPMYITDLKHRDSIEFRECHIMDTDLDDPVPSLPDKYIKRCFVTHNILHQDQPVGFLYREQPEYDDDSGWRITAGNETDEYMLDPSNSSYVSLGAVLRKDDSFLALTESDIGMAFIKDDEGNFVVLED